LPATGAQRQQKTCGSAQKKVSPRARKWASMRRKSKQRLGERDADGFAPAIRPPREQYAMRNGPITMLLKADV